MQIGGVTASRIDSNMIRQRIAHVPENPTLIKGTLKSVLDPLNKFNEAEIKDAIKRIGLEKKIPHLTLETKVTTKIKDHDFGNITA